MLMPYIFIVWFGISYIVGFIHLFIHSFSAAYPVWGCGGAGAYLSILGRRRSTPWTSRQFITGLTWRGIQPSTLATTPTGNFRVTNQPIPSLHVFGMWEETGVPGVNLRRQRKNMQTPHRNVLTRIRIRDLLLTTAPPCHPLSGLCAKKCCLLYHL